MLLTTRNAWGDETIGNVDQGWDVSGNKKEYTLAPGKALTINFTINQTKKTEDFQGWVTQVLNGEDMVFFTQPNCGYWGSGWKWYTGASYNGNTYNWDETNFRENLQGASVNYIIQRVDNNIVLTEHVTTTSTAPNPNVKMGHHFVFPYTSDADLKVVFGADAAVLTITDASISDADPLPTQYGTLVGDELNGTAWWTAFSDYYTLEPNETKSVYFKNYSCKISNGYNWHLGLTNNADRGGDGYTEYVILRSDHYGWASKYADGTITSNYDWNTFRDELDGADVKMTVARDADKVTITATQIAATDGTTVRTETFTFTDNTLASTTMRFFLTTEGGHLDIVDAYHNEVSSAGNGTAAITSTTFEDGYVNKGASVTVTATPDDGYRFVNWTEGGDVVSTNASYTYNATGNRNLVANFVQVCSYTVNAIDGSSNVLYEIATGSADFGSSVTIAYDAFYLKSNGDLLQADRINGNKKEYNYTFVVDEDNKEVTVTYNTTSYSNIVFYKEAEDIATLTEVANGNVPARCSGAKAAYAASDAVITTLGPGKYKLSSFAWGIAGTELSVYAGENLIKTFTTEASTLNITTSEEFTLETNTDIIFKTGGNGGNSPKVLDFFFIQKTAVSGSIASSGYSSLATPYGLDFANATGLTAAYVVSEITKTAVRLTSVAELPAGSGVILKGAPGATYSIPVKADASYDGTNKLHAAVTAYDCDANEVYILQGGLFHLVTAASTVPAGKAYLLAADVPDVPNEARSLIISDEEDPTAINAIEAAESEAGALKDGKYLIDGKIIIVKNGVKYSANGQILK